MEYDLETGYYYNGKKEYYVDMFLFRDFVKEQTRYDYYEILRTENDDVSERYYNVELEDLQHLEDLAPYYNQFIKQNKIKPI